MPCNGDYLDPTNIEEEAKRVANLILYVNSFSNEKTPVWIRECAENYYSGHGNKLARDVIDELVSHLCDKITNMTDSKRNKIIYNSRNKVSRDLASWWEEHQEADRLRLEDEAKEFKRLELRKYALSKLSRAERNALGL